MSNKVSALTKDDANKALDNISMWINNCDTKVSVLLAFYAALITVCLSTDVLKIQSDILKCAMDNLNFWRSVYLMIYIVSILSFLIGLFLMIMVIVPRITLKNNSKNEYESIMFYGSIAKQTPTYENYRERVYEVTDKQDIFEDILFQVHSAAIICNRKFRLYKQGLLFATSATFGILILNVIGINFL